MASFTKKEILDQFDTYGATNDYRFPVLDHGYVCPVGARLSAYGDERYWAILFEILGYNPRSGADGGIFNQLYAFGNYLTPRIGAE